MLNLFITSLFSIFHIFTALLDPEIISVPSGEITRETYKQINLIKLLINMIILPHIDNHYH